MLVIIGFGSAIRAAAATPSFSHVFIVMEKNHSYSEVVGSPLMPYLNMLINNYAQATQYFANEHGSLPNYLWITSGSNDGVTIDTCFRIIWSEAGLRARKRGVGELGAAVLAEARIFYQQGRFAPSAEK